MFSRWNEYHFVTHWRIQDDIAQVYEVLHDPLNYPDWWKGPHLQATELKPGNEEGLNRIVGFEMRGWLPYTLRWRLRCTEVRKPYGFASESSGDFVGHGVWTFKQDGLFVDIIFDWRIRAEKPFLRYFSFLLKPIFIANHNWVMKKWEESLKLELVRRRDKSVLVA